MPHDKNGKLLQVGDTVLVEMTVREVYPGADFCGVSLIRKVEGEQELYLTCQAKQLEKVATAEEATTQQPAPEATQEQGTTEESREGVEV